MVFFVGFPDKLSKRRAQKYTYFIFMNFAKNWKEYEWNFLFNFSLKSRKISKNNVCIFCGLLLENLSGNPKKKHIQFEKLLQKWEMVNKTPFSGVFSHSVDLVISCLLFPPRAHVCLWTVNGRYLYGANWIILITRRTVLLRCYFLTYGAIFHSYGANFINKLYFTVLS